MVEEVRQVKDQVYFPCIVIGNKADHFKGHAVSEAEGLFLFFACVCLCLPVHLCVSVCLYVLLCVCARVPLADCAAALCDVIGKSFAKALKCQYFKTSAKKNDNVDNAFQSVSECLAKEKTKDGQANHTRAYSNTNMHIHTHTCMLTYMLTHTRVLTHTLSLAHTFLSLNAGH